MLKNQTLLVQDNSVNWLQYVEYERKASEPLVFTQRKDRAVAVDFSQDCESLRIGAQVYVRNNEGEYATIPTLCKKQGERPYIEEFASRGPFVVLASRRRAIAESRLSDPRVAEPSANEPDPAKAKEGSG